MAGILAIACGQVALIVVWRLLSLMVVMRGLLESAIADRTELDEPPPQGAATPAAARRPPASPPA